jgi:Tfp pilus assembly protein PilP
MTLTGKAAEDFAAEVRAKARQLRAEELAAAKADAAKRGKEPFDLEKLETMCDTTREGKLDPVETRRTRFEEMYYTFYPDVMTLAEFAKKVEELNRW